MTSTIEGAVCMLTIEEFKRQEEACQALKPGRFRLARPDPPASVNQINTVEEAIGIRLPDSYRQFLSSAGGGDYPLLSIFSANPESAFYLPRRLADLQSVIGANLLPVHDDQAGGLRVLKVSRGEASESVYYWDWETRELSGPRYESVLDMVADCSFR